MKFHPDCQGLLRNFVHCALYFLGDTVHLILWHGACRDAHAHFEGHGEDEIFVEAAAGRRPKIL